LIAKEHSVLKVPSISLSIYFSRWQLKDLKFLCRKAHLVVPDFGVGCKNEATIWEHKNLCL
jgi:hypothetical protein